MLEGVNTEWVDAGARRQATFANVPPGRHRLRVSATNDGLWTEARIWDFSIALPFYKTNRFYALCRSACCWRSARRGGCGCAPCSTSSHSSSRSARG